MVRQFQVASKFVLCATVIPTTIKMNIPVAVKKNKGLEKRKTNCATNETKKMTNPRRGRRK